MKILNRLICLCNGHRWKEYERGYRYTVENKTITDFSSSKSYRCIRCGKIKT